MGHLGHELARVDESLLGELLRVYADEWFAHYNYFVVSYLVAGPSSASVSQVLRDKSHAALRRADRLAQRIVEVGGEPIPGLADLMDQASDKPFKRPEDTRDVEGLLRAVLDADRTSMRSFSNLYQRCHERDPLTGLLLLELLRESVGGEQQLERLLASPAPEMDGK